MRHVLVDTGPLVAILSKDDHRHEDCVEALRSIPAPLLTCWPVLTEAAWLLRSQPLAVEALLRGGTAGLFRILPLTEKDSADIATLLRKYSQLKPQLADAALVHLAQREKIGTVFTLDRRDFNVYRPGRGRAFQILP